MKIKQIKIVIVLLFVILTGTIYSCNNSNTDLVSVEDPSSEDVNKEGISDFTSSTGDATMEIEDLSDQNKSVQDSTVEEATKTRQDIYVHISGAVKNPGVYEAKDNTRIYELIEVAGGLTEDAAGDYINQATLLVDGQQVYIPTKKELEDSQVPLPGDLSNQEKDLEKDKNNKVNINTASKEELMTLSGIGEAKANSIIEYRQQHGNFKKIEDIMNISGIKDAAFSKISDFITVN